MVCRTAADYINAVNAFYIVVRKGHVFKHHIAVTRDGIYRLAHNRRLFKISLSIKCGKSPLLAALLLNSIVFVSFPFLQSFYRKR